MFRVICLLLPDCCNTTVPLRILAEVFSYTGSVTSLSAPAPLLLEVATDNTPVQSGLLYTDKSTRVYEDSSTPFTTLYLLDLITALGVAPAAATEGKSEVTSK